MSPRARAAKSFPRIAALGVSGLALTTVLTPLPYGTAMADPALTIPEAKAQIEQLEVEAEAIDQDYAGVQEQVAAGQAKLKLKQSDVKTQSAKVAKMRKQVGQVALARFQNRSIDTAARVFLTDDAEEFLNQISTVQKVGSNQNSVLQDFQQQQASLADLQASAASDLVTLQGKQKQLASLRTASEAKLTEARKVLQRLTEEEKRELARQEEQARKEAQAAAEAAIKDAAPAKTKAPATSDSEDSAGTDGTGGAGAVPASGRGTKALAFARAQLGKPYRFGAEGPSAYDCSGLTSSAWAAAGVSIRRTVLSSPTTGRRWPAPTSGPATSSSSTHPSATSRSTPATG